MQLSLPHSKHFQLLQNAKWTFYSQCKTVSFFISSMLSTKADGSHYQQQRETTMQYAHKKLNKIFQYRHFVQHQYN